MKGSAQARVRCILIHLLSTFQKKIKVPKNNKPKQPKEQKPTITAPVEEKPKKNKKNKKQKTNQDDTKPKSNGEKSLAVPMKAKDKKQKKGTASSSLTDKLKESLKASRFRFLNECLYKSKSAEAVKMFREDPEAFAVYHEGYRQQVAHWPTNPLDRIIKAIKKM